MPPATLKLLYCPTIWWWGGGGGRGYTHWIRILINWSAGNSFSFHLKETDEWERKVTRHEAVEHSAAVAPQLLAAVTRPLQAAAGSEWFERRSRGGWRPACVVHGWLSCGHGREPRNRFEYDCAKRNLYGLVLLLIKIVFVSVNCNPFAIISRTSGQYASMLHCKKRLSNFPSPAGMSLTKLSLGGNNLQKLFPSRESLVSDIPDGDGKIKNLFLLCIL
jgi:hypothetical protein